MMMTNNMENVTPHVIKVVARQMQTLAQEKMEGINLIINEDDMTDIQVRIELSLMIAIYYIILVMSLHFILFIFII